MLNPTIIQDQVCLLADVSALYLPKTLFTGCSGDPVQALSKFVSAYAFEHQGRSPVYGPVAGDLVEAIGKTGDLWQDPGAPAYLWQQFRKKLHSLSNPQKENARNNPICPQGYRYRGTSSSHATQGLSALEFVQQHLHDNGYDIVCWTKSELEQDKMQDAHAALCTINGVGAKIASMFLRDVAWYFGVQPQTKRDLLQPMDIWVQRVVRRLDAGSKDREAAWIVEHSVQAGVLPEAVNAGMWYFGAQIAGNQYRLAQVLGSPDESRQLVERHVGRLDMVVCAWLSGEADAPRHH